TIPVAKRLLPRFDTVVATQDWHPRDHRSFAANHPGKQPGDRVFLFGFSRGAYTARALAGLLHMFGLLAPSHANLLPYVMRLFRGTRRVDNQDSKIWRVSAQFRNTFARDAGVEHRRFRVHFVGVWDTVSSVGWIWDPVKFRYTAANPSVVTVRHAVAVDERRSFFRQNLFAADVRGQDLLELWFPGVHSDVGGGYPESFGGLWREPFTWMLEEAKKTGLLIDPERVQRVLTRMPAPENPWAEPQHESLTWAWWPAEFFPKLRYNKRIGRRLPSLGLGRRRRIEPGALLHRSVLQRMEGVAGYAPPNLQQTRLVRDTADVIRV
ncbi:MAG TPA: DUF2235 domain-containing protein, partial [Steroidobacteraceae bacterium]|nr:DUF2235 domain-containing protein [Steroidobacteraceae bacterium]